MINRRKRRFVCYCRFYYAYYYDRKGKKPLVCNILHMYHPLARAKSIPPTRLLVNSVSPGQPFGYGLVLYLFQKICQDYTVRADCDFAARSYLV